MTENRPFAVWLRSIAGLVVLAGLLGLAGCGGGSGAPNNPFRASGLTVSLGSPDLYSGVAATLTVTGGFPPYLVTSSKPNVLAIAQSDTAGVFTLTPAG